MKKNLTCIECPIGCEIEGNRLGLGTNLFSDRKTLYDEVGYSYLCDEINKVSYYYQNNLYKKGITSSYLS